MKPKSSCCLHNVFQARAFTVALSFPSKALFLAMACSLGAVSLSPTASADSYTWDATTGTAGIQDGAGNWTGANNWLLNGAGSNLAWPNSTGDTAVFGNGGVGGSVTVGTVNVGTISFTPTTTTAYTLATGTITMGTGTAGSAAITNTNTLGSTISAKISGTSGLNFTGVANSTVAVTLSGANDYTGITNVATGGRLTSNATGFGSAAGATASVLGGNHTVVNTGAGIGLTGSSSEAFLINGIGQTAGTVNPQGAIRFAAGMTLSSLVQLGSSAQITSNGSGTVTLNGDLDLAGFTLSVGNGSLSFAGNVPLVVGGKVTGAASILDVGAAGGFNVVNLNSSNNDYSGTTRVNFGTGVSTVGLGSNNALGTSTLVFNGGGVQSTDTTARTIANTIGNVTGNATFGASPGQNFTVKTGTLTFTSTTSSSLANAARTFTTNVDTSLSNPFSSTGTSGGIVKAGAATLTLAGASTYTGPTAVNAGTLLATNTTGSATGTGAVTLTNLVGTAVSSQTVTGASASYQITGTGLNVLGLQLGQSITGTGIPAGTVIAAISSTQITLSRPLTAAASTFSTTAYNSSPVLQLGNNNATGSLAPASSISLNSGATFRINRSDAATQGTHFSAAAITGGGRIEQAGSGTTTLNAANSYTGTTTVSAGTLLIDGTNSGSGAVDVGASGTLGGIGTIAGGVNVTGVLSPGASIESLATGTVAFISGSKLIYELQDTSAVGADLVDITGNLSLAGTVTLDLVKLGAGAWSVGNKLTLLSYTGSITANSYFNFVDGGDGKLTDDETFSFDGSQWVFDYNDLVAGSNYSSEASGTFVTMTVIPEPTSAILLSGFGVLALFRRRRNS